MSQHQDNPQWDASFRFERQALALDERVFNAMDAVANTEQQLSKVAEACTFLCAKVERLEDEKRSLLQRQAEIATERADLRNRLTASMAVAAASAASASATELELAQLKRDYELYRQRSQIDANSRKVELDACRLELKERDLSLSDAEAVAKAAESRIAEMEKHHSQAFGELFVSKEDLEEEFQAARKRAEEAEDGRAAALRQIDEERIARSTFESRIVDTALLGLQLREDVDRIHHEMAEELKSLDKSHRKHVEDITRAALQAAKTNSLLQAQMLEAVQVISHAQTDIVAFREFTEESQHEAHLLAAQALLQEQKLQTTELELSQMTAKTEGLQARNHVLEHEKSELQKRLDEDAGKHGRMEQLAAEAASRSNQEIAELLKERQELGAGFDEAIERTNAAEEELGKVREQIDEMKSQLMQLEQERERNREEITRNEEELAELKEDLAIKDEALSMAADESMSLKQDRQLELMRRDTESSGQETALRGLILDLQSARGETKEMQTAMLMSEAHFGQCCEVRTQTLEELQKQRDRSAKEIGELREKAARAEQESQAAHRASERLQLDVEAANQRTETAEGKMAEAVREVVRERGARTEVERRLEQLAGLTKSLNLDVREAVRAGHSQQAVVTEMVDTTEVRNKDVFLLMAELDGCESKISQQAKQLREFQERESDAQIEISRLQADLDALRSELRDKQRDLNLANIAAGEAVEKAKQTRDEGEAALAETQSKLRAVQREKEAVQREKEAGAEQLQAEREANAEQLQAEREANAKQLAAQREAQAAAARAQQAAAEGLVAEMRAAAQEAKGAHAELKAAEAHYGQCCEARIDCMVEMRGVKDLVEALRQSAEQAQAEVYSAASELCRGLQEAQGELCEAAAETEARLAESERELRRERLAREGMEGQNTQMGLLLEQLHSDATKEAPVASRAPAAIDAALQTLAMVPDVEREARESMQVALQAAERRAEETRRSILMEQGARADVERRLGEMAALARALLSDLSEAIVIQEEVVPSLMEKKQATEDVYLLMAELDATETQVTEQTNRAAVFQQREAAARREIAVLQEELVAKQEQFARELAEAHQQLAETADDNKDLVARLFQTKQDSFQAARLQQEASLSMSAGLDEAEGALNHLDGMLKLVHSVGSTRGGSTRALEEECRSLRDVIGESEARKEEMQARLMDAANRMAKFQADMAAEQHQAHEERESWNRTRRELLGHVERLQAEVEGAKSDLHRSNMVIVQLESRALKQDGTLAAATRGEGLGPQDLREVGGQMEMLRTGLRTVEQRCETLDAENKESRQREKALWVEKQELLEQLKQKKAEAERLSLDLLTSLKDLDDTRGKVKRMSRQLLEASESMLSVQGDLSLVGGSTDAISTLEDLLNASHLEARKVVKKATMLEGTCQVLKSALEQSEARGVELQTLLTEGTSRISVLQDDLSAERRKHDTERLRVDAEFASCARGMREAQGRASALEAEQRMLKEEIAALHASQYANVSRGPKGANSDPDATKSTVVARERGMSGRGMEVTWSPIRADGEVGSDGDDAQAATSRFGRGAVLDREWMRRKPDESGSVVGALDVTEHEMSWDRSRNPGKGNAHVASDAMGDTASSRQLTLRGGPQGLWQEESNMRIRVAEQKAAKAEARCKELSDCIQRLQDECRLLRSSANGAGKPSEVAAHTENLTVDLLTALKNLDEARNERQASILKHAEIGRENLRLSEELRMAEIKHRAEVEGLRSALSHTQEVRARANEVAAELLSQVRALQGTIRDEGERSPPDTRKGLWPSQRADYRLAASPAVAPANGTPRRAGTSAYGSPPDRVQKLEVEKEQLAIKLEALRSALQSKDQKLGVLEKCLEMASARESGVFSEMHAMHVDMCNDWQAISAASARRAGGAELQLLSMIGENKLMTAEGSSTDLAKKAADMRGVYKKVIVEMKRAHSKLISELETALGSQEDREGGLGDASSEVEQLRVQVSSLRGSMRSMQEELLHSRQARAAVEGQLQESELRARALLQQAAVAQESARSERGKSHQKAEEAEGLKSRIITLVRKVEQSRQEASSARLRAPSSQPSQRTDQELQLALREEHLQQLQQELLAVHESQQELHAAHDSFKRQEHAWRARVAELEHQLAASRPAEPAPDSAPSPAQEALRQQLRAEQDRRDVVERRCAEEEERRKDLEVAVRRAEQAQGDAEAEAHGLRARLKEREEQRGRAMRVETRKSELEEQVEQLQHRLRDAASMQAVLRDEAERERAVAASAVRQLEGSKRQVETGRARTKELEGQLQRAAVLVEELQRQCRGVNELLLAVELAVMADSRERSALQGRVKGSAAREEELAMQVQTLRSALHEQSIDSLLEPRIVDVPTQVPERAPSATAIAKMEEQHAEKAAQKKMRALEAQVSDLRQRELRWEETAGRYKRELSAVRRELDGALDAVDKARRDKEQLERGRSVREAKLEGEIALLEQRLHEARFREGDGGAAVDDRISPPRSLRRGHHGASTLDRERRSDRSYGAAPLGSDRSWGYAASQPRY